MTLFAVARYLPNGQLDTTFGEGGKVTIAMSEFTNTRVSSQAVQIDRNDNITICGNIGPNNVGIVRLRPNGEIDSIIGNETKFVTPFMKGRSNRFVVKVLIAQPRQIAARDMNLLPTQPSSTIGGLSNIADETPLGSGIVAIGQFGIDPTKIATARYTSSGQLDKSFSNDGKASRTLQQRSAQAKTGAFNRRTNRIVAIANSIEQDIPRIHMIMYQANGSIDSAFGLNGISTIEIIDCNIAWVIEPHDSVFQDDELIISGSGFLPFSNEDVAKAPGEFVVLKIRSNGIVDLNFGMDFCEGDDPINSRPLKGVALARFGDGPRVFASTARSVKIDARSRIIAAGQADRRFALARFMPDGSLDMSFSNNGKVMTGFKGESLANVVKIDTTTRQRIVAGGEAGNQFALVRYRNNGSLDTNFGNNGRVRTVFTNENLRSSILDIAFDSQERIVAVGDIARVPPID